MGSGPSFFQGSIDALIQSEESWGLLGKKGIEVGNSVIDTQTKVVRTKMVNVLAEADHGRIQDDRGGVGVEGTGWAHGRWKVIGPVCPFLI